jgi:hypothetical protein
MSVALLPSLISFSISMVLAPVISKMDPMQLNLLVYNTNNNINNNNMAQLYVCNETLL